MSFAAPIELLRRTRWSSVLAYCLIISQVSIDIDKEEIIAVFSCLGALARGTRVDASSSGKVSERGKGGEYTILKNNVSQRRGQRIVNNLPSEGPRVKERQSFTCCSRYAAENSKLSPGIKSLHGTI